MDHLAVFRVEGRRPSVVILQYPGIETGNYVFAAPLYPAAAAKPIDIVTPRVSMNGEDYLVGVHLMASIRRDALGGQIGSLIDHEYEIQRALARLFFGN